ncbi:MAG TPA: molybdenum cofactor guanylyltransferase [Candidatus Limnocylindrales bacterium]
MQASGIVLAGGQSRRMGRDKRLVEVDGRPMLAAAIDLLGLVSDDVIAACGRSQPSTAPAGPGVRIAFDAVGEGPLAGIEAGLAAARHEVALVVPVDMPYLTAPTVRRLLDALADAPDFDGAVFGLAGRGLPLPVAYRRSVLPALRARLARGEFRLRDWHATLRLTMVEGSLGGEGGEGRQGEDLFVNVNRATDLLGAAGRGEVSTRDGA